MSNLRIRDNAVITELHITNEQRAKVQQMVNRNPNQRNNIVKKVTGHGYCQSCGQVPDVLLSYDCDGAKRLERYCNSCIKKVFSRMDNEPTDKEELALFNNCERVNEIPPRVNEP